MWRSILAVVLLPSLTAAQAELPKTNPQTTSEAWPKLVLYRSFDQLRRGTDEKVAIIVGLPGFLTSPRSPVPEVVPITLELDPSEGIALGRIDYPKPFKHKFGFQQERIAAFQFPWQHLEFRVRAAPGAAVGQHMLTGTLRWQVLTDSGVSAPQQMQVQIPINVVEHAATVVPTKPWPAQDRIPPWDDMPTAEKVVVIPLLPVLVLLAGVVCMMRGEDCRC